VKIVLRVGLAGILCLGAAGAAVFMLADPRNGAAIDRIVRAASSRRQTNLSEATSAARPAPSQPEPSFPLFSSAGFENAGYPTACRFTGPIADRSSIGQLSAAIKGRGRRGIDALLSELRSIPPNSPQGSVRVFQIQASLALLSMYEGNFDQAAASIESALAASSAMPSGLRANMGALLGVVHLRRGETDNCLECLGPSSCIFPIVPEAVHQRPSGSRAATSARIWPAAQTILACSGCSTSPT
jgi:hypothetical protein